MKRAAQLFAFVMSPLLLTSAALAQVERPNLRQAGQPELGPALVHLRDGKQVLQPAITVHPIEGAPTTKETPPPTCGLPGQRPCPPIPYGNSTCGAPGERPCPPDPYSNLPKQVDFDTSYITFNGGVPVDAFSHVTLYNDGRYVFTGHFHDSGATTYADELVWAIKAGTNVAFTFSHTGKINGTFDSGSRDDNWNETGTNPQIAAAWKDLCNGHSTSWTAGLDLDIGLLVSDVMKVIGYVSTVVSVV
jgi:hypothetical protein